MDDSTKQLIEQLEIIKAQIEWDYDISYQVVLEDVITILKDDDIKKIVREKYGE